MACCQFTALNGASSAIHNMTAAYNAETKEARIYTEFERMDEKVIEDSLRNKGIGSVIIDSFSSENWKSASKIALDSVMECCKKPGFSLFRHGNASNEENTAGASASGGEGGAGGGNGASSGEEQEHNHIPRPSSSSTEEESDNNKRRRTVSPEVDGGVKNMVPFDVMMDKMSAAMSSVVASAINSSGAVYNKERENALGSVQVEQQRRERAECQLREAEIKMAQRLINERQIIEEESAVKYRELEAKFLETSLLKVVIFFISF